MTIIRNGWGFITHVPTVRETLKAKFKASADFSVMQVMAAINAEIADPAERMTITQISNAMIHLYAGGGLRRIAAARYGWPQ